MTPTLDDPLQSPQESDTESTVHVARTRPPKSALNSVAQLPYRHSNPSLSNLFASTTSLPTQPHGRSESESAVGTATGTTVNGSLLSPDRTAIGSPAISLSDQTAATRYEIRDLIVRAFCPHISVLASQDTEELIRHKGIDGGLLELLRPFGEHVPGKVTIRDSSGASKSWEDFSIRFTGVKDGLESPRAQDRRSTDSTGRNGQRASMGEYKPARLKSGGDVPQIEDLAERHLTFAEERSGPIEDHIITQGMGSLDPQAASPFYKLYLRRLLSGLPMVPSETFSHPVALVIAISSRSPAPIEELRTLYASSNTGEHRLPQWVHNEFLRYYVLVHDEDYDDIQKSMALYDQMKRHFGLHCHLLRLRSTQCVPTDDDVTKLPHCEWLAAAEELAEIVRRETSEDDEDPTPYIFETDATAIRAFIREMVMQSIIPSMERASATWNDQVASRRRGISGRFMSLSKRFTAFGGSRNSSVPIGGSGSNYDSLQGFYRPDAPEAIMRKLADYAMMLRDYKLAQGTFEILCSDFKYDKAWRYHAAANEMAAVTALLATSGTSNKIRVEGIDQYLDQAYYSYTTRVGAPYNALRTLILGVELLKLRGGPALDEATRWASKILNDRLVGPVGHVLLMERIASCFATRKAATTALPIGERKRRAAFWNLLATEAWMRMEKASRAESTLIEATRMYTDSRPSQNGDLEFGAMRTFLDQLQDLVHENRPGRHHLDGSALLANEANEQAQVEALQGESDFRSVGAGIPAATGSLATISAGGHARNLSTVSQTSISIPPPPPPQASTLDPIGASIYETAAANPHTSVTRARRKSSLSVEPSLHGQIGVVEPATPARKADDGFDQA